MTWDDLDLYYGHKAQELILTHISNTTHADSLGLFALNINIVLANVTKPKIRTFWLWPDLWRHQWPLGHISHHVWKVHVQGYRMTLHFGNRSSSLRDHGGGGDTPPTECVTRESSTGGGFGYPYSLKFGWWYTGWAKKSVTLFNANFSALVKDTKMKLWQLINNVLTNYMASV